MMFTHDEIANYCEAMTPTAFRDLMAGPHTRDGALSLTDQFYAYAGEPILRGICHKEGVEPPTAKQIVFVFLALSAANRLQQRMIDNLAKNKGVK